MQNITISYIQAPIIWENRSANRAILESKIEALSGKTNIVLLPEMFDTGFTMNPEKLSEPDHARTLDWMQTTARRYGVVLCGSTVAKSQQHFYNRLFWVDEKGQATYYNKRHLFRMGEEPRHYTAGQEKIIIQYQGWNILPLICYDLRFPLWSANGLRNKKPAYDMLLYVANWPAARSHVWKALLQARALENQAYCIGVNRVGIDGYGLSYSGDSMAFDAKGNTATRSTPYLEHMATFIAKANELKNFREKFPVFKDWNNFEV
ncbi:MAG: amidohydrolase [Bacteroidales bacterium]